VSFEQAREYFSKILPWPQAGEPPFKINVHWTTQPQGRDKPLWTGRATQSIDEAIRTIEWASGLPETRDIYACMSGQSQATEKVSKKGHKYLLPVRAQNNAVKLKSLFLDIDVKADGGYATVTQAVTALGDFLKAAGLPKPSMVVSSGGGLHVYWALDRALDRTSWQPLANALASAAKQHGLKCDTGCTIDSARVLRVPDTVNCKRDPRRPVRILASAPDCNVETIEQALQAYTTSAAPALPQRAPITAPNDLAAGIEMNKLPPVDLDAVAPECAFIGKALAEGGKTYSNPLWNLTTLISVFTAGGRADAHRMASQHPDYTIETTDDLFDRKTREQNDKGLGWPACKTIALSGCTDCSVCPHKDEGKTPLHFAPKPAPVVTPPTINVNDLPVGYDRNAAGYICKRVVDENGATFLALVMPYLLSNPWLQSDPWILNFTAITHVGHKKQIAIPLTATATKEGVPKALTGQGLVCREGQYKGIREFLVDWITMLQQGKNSVVSSSPFGWQMKNGSIEGFIFAGEMVTPTGVKPAANPDPSIARQYRPTGDEKYWRTASTFLTNQKRPSLDAVLASAFAAPLVQFTGQSGLQMSLYSPGSGLGKSTALKIAQTVWGDAIHGMQGLGDTPLSVQKKMGETRSLPMYWDELKTEADTYKFVNMLFNLTSGREKTRLNSDVTFREAGSWTTLLVSASNDSLVDYILNRTKTTTAGVYRILEYEVEPGTIGQLNPAEVDHMLGKLNNNFGNVGKSYAVWLGQNFVQIEDEVTKLQSSLVDRFNIAKDERFWLATITVILMGAKYANQLGYTDIDEDALFKFMEGVLEGMRNIRKEKATDLHDVMSISNVLAQYLNAMRARHTIWTNRIHISAGKPPKGTIQVVRQSQMLDGIYVHIGVEDKLMRISSTNLSQWLADVGVSRHLFTRALEKEFGSKQVRGRIASGTDFAGATEYLLEIDLSGTPVANFIDEA